MYTVRGLRGVCSGKNGRLGLKSVQLEKTQNQFLTFMAGPDQKIKHYLKIYILKSKGLGPINSNFMLVKFNRGLWLSMF